MRSASRLREAERVVLIGGSYIGAEVAASLRAQGAEVAIVMLEEVALSRTFGEEVGRFFHDALAEHGVEIHGGEELEAFEGDGNVQAVVTKSGLTVEGELVVVGAGVRPDQMLAERAGLEVDDGIVCDQRLETSAAGIFAAGDVCSYDSVVHGRRLRVEHWDVALQQGRHVARAMLGSAEPYREIPYFFSDLADWASMEYVGPAYEWDEVIWRGEREAGRVQRLVSRGRGGQGRARRRALRGPDPRAHPDRDRGGRVDARGGACGPGFRARVDRAIRATGPLCFARAVGRPASVAPWCNGSTPRSGRGSWGSNPWGAVTTSGLRGG